MVNPRVLFSLALLAFGSSIVLISAYRQNQSQVYGGAVSNSIIPSQNHELLAINQVISSHELSYYFPSPGILPDHPLYWVKMIRDKIQLIFTIDKNSKITLKILYADKRLSAGYLLVTKQQESLGISTITKSEKYLQSAIFEAKKLQDAGDLQNSELQILIDSTQAHHIVIKELLSTTSGENHQTLSSMSELNQDFLNNNIQETTKPEQLPLPLEASKSASPSSQPKDFQ